MSKPVIIHCREAYPDLISILSEKKYSKLQGVCHCFSGTGKDAAKILELGFHISFAGPVTFPKAGNLREIVAQVPVEKMLLETDSPYLSPQPFRGKRNEPSFIIHNAEKIAEIHKLTLDEVRRKTTLNAESLFDLKELPNPGILTYELNNNLYINFTRNCTNDCVFCRRKTKPSIKKYDLHLSRDPTAEEIIKDIRDVSKYNEIVFCGFGEPLLRLDTVVKVAEWLKNNSAKLIRIDTNGQGNLIHGRNIVPELKGIIDAFSISLNACNESDYQRFCNPCLGISSYKAVKDFIRECKKHFDDVIVSIVGIEGISVDNARRIIEDDLKCRFRLRPYRKEF